MHKGKATANMLALQGAIFNLQFDMAYKLTGYSISGRSFAGVPRITGSTNE